MGAQVATHIGGTPNRLAEYPIASEYAANIFVGDFVKLASDGTIQVAAAGDRLLGVFQGCFYTDATGRPQFSKSWTSGTVATDARASVSDDEREIYVVQTSGTLSGQTVVGTLADIVAGTGNSTTGISGHTISGTTGTGTAQLRIKALWRSPDNAWGQYARVEVQIFEHEYAGHGQSTPGV